MNNSDNDAAAVSSTSASLAQVRSEIDRLDQAIIALISERQKWVIQAGRLKKDEDGVRDPGRVEQVITKVRDLANESGASPDVVEKTYRAMISGFIDLELAVHRGVSN